MYQGYLVKVGNFIIPMRFMIEKSYNAKVNTLDQDAYNDADGVLQRNVIQQIPKVSFKTLPWTNVDAGFLMSNCRQNFSNQKERKATVSVWVPEYDDYVTQEMYMSDPEFVIGHIDGNTIHYESTQFTFTAYGVR